MLKRKWWFWILILVALTMGVGSVLSRSELFGRHRPVVLNGITAPPHDSTGHTWHHPDEILLDITANGGDSKYNSKMPAFRAQLSREQMAAVLEFIKSRWGREAREYQWWMTTIGSQ